MSRRRLYKRERFLAGFREAPIGHPEFVLRQFGFIKKRIWFLYSLMFAATLFIGTQTNKNAEEALWWFSAALPFLTIFLVTGSFRVQSPAIWLSWK